jgi:hypothetical protein
MSKGDVDLYDDDDALTEASTVVGCDRDIGESAHQRSLQRVHWLVVHSGASRLSVAALCGSGLAADGCHSTVDDSGSLVSYIHLSSRCRQTTLSKLLLNQGAARIIDSANEKTLISTPEFLLLVRHIQERDPRLVLDGEGFGLLSKHVGKKPSRLELENAELRQRVACMESERVLMEQRLQDALQDRSRMEDEMGSLRLALSHADGERSELKRLRIENTEFRRLGAEEKEVRRLNRELHTLGDDLQAKSQDCRVLEAMLRVAREDNAKLREIASHAPRPSNYS